MAIVLGLEGWRGVIADTFTIRNSRLICQAMADQLLAEDTVGNGVVVGYDTRFLSERFARECAQVFAANGIPVYLLDGVTPTPLLSFAVRYFGASRGLMVTAGHRAHDANGLKWKGTNGRPLSAQEVQGIAAQVGQSKVETMPFDLAVEEELIRLCNVDAPYFSQLHRFLSSNPSQERHLHVVVDTMHGAGGAYFAKMLQEIGCRVTVLRDTPDPLFGGVDPEPVAANLAPLREKVREVGADLGLATDGDGDRLAAVDAAGDVVSPQMLSLLLTEHVTSVRKWTGDVVKTFSTTDSIDAIASKQGATVRVVPVGFTQISDVMQKEDVVIGGDDSGGIAIPRHLPDRDALFAAVLLIEHLLLTDQTLNQAVTGMEAKVGARVYERVDLPLSRKRQEALFHALRQNQRTFAGLTIAKVETVDGVKYRLTDGSWLLFRGSNTEPLLRIYGEGDRADRVRQLLERAVSLASRDLSRI